MIKKHIPFLFLLVLLAGCSKRIVIHDQGKHKIRNVLQSTGLPTDHYMGFALYDPDEHKMIYQLNSDKYFVPASNTKIFTLYTALNYLPDTLPCIELASNNDQITIRGTGHPGFLHPEFEIYQHAFSEIIDTSKELFLSDLHYKDKRFGDGWAWNDYSYGYQSEKSALPIYANLVWVTKANEKLEFNPNWYASFFTMHEDDELPLFYRDESANAFSFDPERLPENGAWEIPFIYSGYEVSQILGEELGKTVKPTYAETHQSFTPAYHVPLDTVYRKLMRHSDNFIAEQLLLASGHRKLGFMETDSIIRFAKSDLFDDAPDPLLWYDGSGLSRYNMFTPRTIVWVLNQLYRSQSTELLKSIFPAGGVSGTIRNWYPGETPYVYAKTGTLRNKHCLSGYLFTKSGKVLIFSFMHNNYPGGSNKIKEKMQLVLEYIRDSF
jgi:D-alanyl-D-alanine carboxypeptidase/D-alanyl-D-alanine-endopeptidase (penicillin-binding protein 4)